MQTANSETEIKSRFPSVCVHHYTLVAPCPKGQGIKKAQSATNSLGVFNPRTPWKGKRHRKTSQKKKRSSTTDAVLPFKHNYPSCQTRPTPPLSRCRHRHPRLCRQPRHLFPAPNARTMHLAEVWNVLAAPDAHTGNTGRPPPRRRCGRMPLSTPRAPPRRVATTPCRPTGRTRRQPHRSRCWLLPRQ